MANNVAELKDRLQQALSIRGWKAADLVAATGVPKGAISYYLSGRSTPKADRLYIIAQALNVNEAWLLGYDISMERSPESKKNDQLAKLIVRLRTDAEFYKTVSALAELPESQYRGIVQLIAAFNN